MNKEHLEQVLFRLKTTLGAKSDRDLSLKAGKNENYFNNCKVRGDISIKMLVSICEKHGLDYNYIHSGVSSEKLIHLKDDEIVIKKSDWNNLQIQYKTALEIAMGKTAQQEDIGDHEKSGVVAGNKHTKNSHDPP
jgi:hypothetical protein